MNQEERIQQLLEKNHLDQKDFIISLYSYINKRECDMETFKSIRSNYAKKIKGIERNFTNEEIPYVEELLHTTFAYIVNGVEIPRDFEVKGIRYLAHMNDYELYYKADNTEYNNEENESILYFDDEYGLNGLDYIIQESAYEGLKYYIKELGLHYIFKSDIDELVYSNKNINLHPIAKDLLLLIIKNDDPIVLNEFYDWTDCFNYRQSCGCFEDEDVIKAMLNSNKVFDSLLQPLTYMNKRGCRSLPNNMELEGRYVNPILMKILDYALTNPDLYKTKIIKALEFGYKYNDDTLDYLFDNNIGQMKIFDNGNVGLYDIEAPISKMFKFSETKDCSINEIWQLLEKIRHQLENIDFTVQRVYDGHHFSNKNVVCFNGYYLKKSTGNKNEYDALTLFKENNLSFTPEVKVNFRENVDGFKELEGKKMPDYSLFQNDYLFQIVGLLKEMNAISKSHLNGKVYCHGNLKPNNILLKDGKITGLTGWDHCYIGDEWEEFMYIFFEWDSFMPSASLSDPLFFDKLVKMLKIYGPDDAFLNNFSDKMINYLEKEITNLNKNDASYEIEYKDIKIKEIWVEFNKDKLNSLKKYI